MTQRAFLQGFEKDVQADIAEGELNNADITHIQDIFKEWIAKLKADTKGARER